MPGSKRNCRWCAKSQWSREQGISVDCASERTSLHVCSGSLEMFLKEHFSKM